jgi:hypothetical protein
VCELRLIEFAVSIVGKQLLPHVENKKYFEQRLLDL